jgi:hypothetical protein
MKRAQFYLWTVLHERAGLDEAALSELAGQAADELETNDPAVRRSDMETAVGLWAERADLPDTASYILNLREDSRTKIVKPS